jgi:aspartate-semialdehyde dehydrogenase
MSSSRLLPSLCRFPRVFVSSAVGVLACRQTWCEKSSTFSTTSSPTSTRREFTHSRTASGYAPKRKLRVGVLGATGAVGQRFIEGLQDHPWFIVTKLGASSRSAGKAYGAAATWGISPDVPAYVKDATVVSCNVSEFVNDVDFVFSALDADVAGDVEKEFRDAGIPVFSNARNYRMHADVPLVVPPVNGDHLDLVKTQPSFLKNGGYIVTNANCSTTGMVIALKPLEETFGIERVFCTTLQAISGAGYPGLPSLDILDNVVPYISGEEDKLETEYAKILGKFDATKPAPIVPIAFPLSAMVNRVHVRDGHSIALSIKLKKEATPDEVARVLESYVPSGDVSTLPSSPNRFILVRSEVNRPQPRLDRDTGRGFTTTVGRVRKDPINSVKMFVLSHNTVMGAAGSSILNAELAASKGLLRHRDVV